MEISLLYLFFSKTALKLSKFLEVSLQLILIKGKILINQLNKRMYIKAYAQEFNTAGTIRGICIGFLGH